MKFVFAIVKILNQISANNSYYDTKVEKVTMHPLVL